MKNPIKLLIRILKTRQNIRNKIIAAQVEIIRLEQAKEKKHFDKKTKYMQNVDLEILRLKQVSVFLKKLL